MSFKSALAGLSFSAAAFVVSSALCPPATGQQRQPWVGSILDPAQFARARPLADVLNDESKASDGAGIHRYSEDLVRLLVPSRAGQKYIRSLADRLARAEELARAGKGSLVPESEVAQAYNDLMKKVGAPASLLTDETAVRNLRLFRFDSPNGLITTARNGTSCSPGEAMYLLLALFWNNGGPRVPLAMAPGAAQPSGAKPERWVGVAALSASDPSASKSLHSYSAAHRPRDTAALFNGVAKTMGF